MKARPPRKTIEERRADFRARHPRLARKEAPKPVSTANPYDLITLGVDDAGQVLKIEDRPRMEHMHVIGATGCGKSTFLLNCILQDIARGRGVCVLDPHGGHPDSLLNMVLRFLRDHGWFASKRVHIMAPNAQKAVVGLNPLAPLPHTDPAVIADAMSEAFSRVWGDEDMHKTPLTKRVLGRVFTALSEARLPLASAAELLDYEDPQGVRKTLIGLIKNKHAKAELEKIERLSREKRGLSDFNAYVLGPSNRLAEFLACQALERMFSMTKEHDPSGRLIDILEIINRGHILLIDLQHGPAVSEAASDLLGKIILRYLYLLAGRRKWYQVPGTTEKKYHPFYVYVDEAHRYLTGDVEKMLFEVRKYGFGVVLAHQFLAQLGKKGESMYEAMRNSTETKVVFRVKSPEEAQALAEDVIPLSLEVPVQASIRPTQVGFTIERLKSETYSVHEGEGESEAVSAAESISQGRTEMQSWMSAQSSAVGTSSGKGTALSLSKGLSQGSANTISSMESMSFSYDPNAMMMVAQNLPLGMNIGTADSVSSSLMSSQSSQSSKSLSDFFGESKTKGQTNAEGRGFAITEGVSTSRGKTLAKNKMRGHSRSEGSTESQLPIYADLPSSFHSKDNELYMKGELIRNLPVGRAIIKFRSNATFLSIPPPRKGR